MVSSLGCAAGFGVRHWTGHSQWEGLFGEMIAGTKGHMVNKGARVDGFRLCQATVFGLVLELTGRHLRPSGDMIPVRVAVGGAG